MKNQNKRMNEQELYECAVSMLAKRDYASGELRTRFMRLTGEDVRVVETVMAQLLSHHYLVDTRIIEKSLPTLLNKGYGPARIKQVLRQKGLDTLLIEQALEDLDVNWFERCQQAKNKKFSDAKPANAKEKAKIVRYLQARGHRMSVIVDVL